MKVPDVACTHVVCAWRGCLCLVGVGRVGVACVGAWEWPVWGRMGERSCVWGAGVPYGVGAIVGCGRVPLGERSCVGCLGVYRWGVWPVFSDVPLGCFMGKKGERYILTNRCMSYVARVSRFLAGTKTPLWG